MIRKYFIIFITLLGFVNLCFAYNVDSVKTISKLDMNQAYSHETSDSISNTNPKLKVFEKKNVAGAVLLSVLLPGGGHYYVGNIGTGLIYTTSEIALFTVFIGSVASTIVTATTTLNESETKKSARPIGPSAFLFLAVKLSDIIHAGLSASEYNIQPQVFIDEKKNTTLKLTMNYNL